MTPYILFYLLHVPDSVYTREKGNVDKAIRFIHDGIVASLADTTKKWDYPNYSAAYASRVFYKTKSNHYLQEKIIEKLALQQFTARRGVSENSMAYGGWGYGEINLAEGEFGHVDLSHTRRITQALLEYFQNNFDRDDNDKLPPPGYFNSNWKEDTKEFLASVQRSPHDPRIQHPLSGIVSVPYDGGFVSSMYTVSTNKSQPVLLPDSTYYYPSYATATCDGLLALHALGLEDSDAYRDAVVWLEKNQGIDVIDGLSPDDPEQWYQIMHYYHWAVRAEAMTAANIDGPWKQNLIDALIKEQQPDGFYINPIGGVNKEDDPLMATIFCLQAFTALAQ